MWIETSLLPIPSNPFGIVAMKSLGFNEPIPLSDQVHMCEKLGHLPDAGEVAAWMAEKTQNDKPDTALERRIEALEAEQQERDLQKTLPITLEPPDSQVFLRALLLTKEAWIEVSYRGGRKEVRRWNATRMRGSSNVIGNLRSRPEFRAGFWQLEGILGLRVSIEHPPD